MFQCLISLSPAPTPHYNGLAHAHAVPSPKPSAHVDAHGHAVPSPPATWLLLKTKQASVFRSCVGPGSIFTGSGSIFASLFAGLVFYPPPPHPLTLPFPIPLFLLLYLLLPLSTMAEVPGYPFRPSHVWMGGRVTDGQ